MSVGCALPWTKRRACSPRTSILIFVHRSGHEVDVRFVLARRLLAQPEPGPVRMRDVLSGVIPPLLIVGAAVRRAQVERVVGLQVLLHSEGDADEPARALRGARRRSAGNLRLDHSVGEVDAVDQCELLDVALFGGMEPIRSV